MRTAPRTPIRYPFRLAGSLTGWAITAFVIWWQITANFGGHLAPDLSIWDRVGDQALRGVSPYSTDMDWTRLFFYAPPWALLFGVTSWLPPVIQAGLVLAAELLALRYIAGSWLVAGYFGLFPITGAELGNGSFNLVVAAAIAAAMRGDGRLAAWCSLAKFSPILAVRDVRRAAVVLVVAGLVTLPVLGWWFDWLRLLSSTNESVAIGYQVWWPGRVAAALVLMAVVRKPWARGLAAAIAVPALYSYSLVLLYPLVALLRSRAVTADQPAASLRSSATASS